MAFKIEDLMFSIKVIGTNQAVMLLEGCDDLTMEVNFASCGMTQRPHCPMDPNLAVAAEGVHVAFRPRLDNLEVLQEELEDALEVLKAVRAALAAPPAEAPPAGFLDDGEDDKPLNPQPDKGDGGESAAITMSDRG